MSDGELNQRWQSAQDRPDHPDAAVLRSELGMRMGNYKHNLRLLYASPDTIRVSSENPIAGRLSDGTLAPLRGDLETAGAVTMVPADYGLVDDVIWQANDTAIGVMPTNLEDYINPAKTIQSSISIVRTLLYPGVLQHSRDAFVPQSVTLGAAGSFRIDLGQTGYVGKGMPIKRIHGVWNGTKKVVEVNRVEYFKDEAARSAGLVFGLQRFSDWKQLGHSDEWYPSLYVKEDAHQLYEHQADGKVKKTEEMRVASAALVPCEDVSVACRAPTITTGPGYFELSDSVRAGWRVTAVQDWIKGKSSAFEGGKMIERTIAMSARIVEPSQTPSLNPTTSGLPPTMSHHTSGSRSLVAYVGVAIILCVVSGTLLWRRFRV